MSVFAQSTRSSRVSSILKTPSIKSKLIASRTPSKVRFQLPHAKKVRTILQDYVRSQNVRDFETLVILVRDAELLDNDVRELLSEATQCISLLTQDLRLFVEAILSLKWTHRSKEVVKEYQSYLINLLSAHNYHAKYAIDKLISNFIPDSEEADWPNGIPSDDDCNKCAGVHRIFSILLKVVPMSRELLLQSLINHYPYYKKPTHVHEYYLHNLLWMLEYEPQFRPDILHLIFTKLVLLDVNAPREEIEKAECESTMESDVFDIDDDLKSVKCSGEGNLKHDVGRTLDVCMCKIFNYVLIECHNMDTGDLDWEKAKGLYHNMIVIFDKVILPTYNIHHVQFVMFHLCSFKTAITEAFLNYLWKKVCTPNIASVLRQSAAAYIASLVARSTFVPLTMLKGTLQQMSEWIHSYISTQDGLECVNSDVRIHTVFYSVCQSLFYVVAFRQKDLLKKKKNITFLESLNMTKIVTCRLNPLRVCQPAIVQNFAALTRTYQLAYCYSVIEHNSRNAMPTIYQDEKGTVLTTNNILDSFFPFDPYVLKRSAEKIYPFYLHFQEITNNEPLQKHKDFEDDDFLCDQSEPDNANSLDKFSYGSSPGFKLNNKYKCQ